MTNLSEYDAKSHTWNLNEVKEKYFFSELFTEQYPKTTLDVRIHLLTLCLIHVLLFPKKKSAGSHSMFLVYLKFCNLISCNVICLKKLLNLPRLFKNLTHIFRISETYC